MKTTYSKIITALASLINVKEDVRTKEEQDLIEDMCECLRFMRKDYYDTLVLNK